MQTTLSISAVLYPATLQRRLFQRNRRFENDKSTSFKSALKKRLCMGAQHGASASLTSPWGMTFNDCASKKLRIALSKKTTPRNVTYLVVLGLKYYERVSKDDLSNKCLGQLSDMYCV